MPIRENNIKEREAVLEHALEPLRFAERVLLELVKEQPVNNKITAVLNGVRSGIRRLEE